VVDPRGRSPVQRILMAIHDQRAFLPSRDFDQSIDFYVRMGWEIRYRDESLALLALDASHFFVQKAYVREWAENMMLHLVVDDAAAWFDKATQVKAEGGFDTVRIRVPFHESYGATVTHVIDPAGVLLHFAQFDA
jgi:catechol 2,3-dioxygenase-like lactoylglutathione lyase family enzyme